MEKNLIDQCNEYSQGDYVGVAKCIVFEIWNDIKDRNGIGNELRNIDEDIQEEMLQGWLDTVESELKD